MKNNFSKILNDKKVILIINICGFLFGSYLYLFTPFKIIGLLLAFVDLTMVIDQITKYKFYNKFSNKYPNFYFLLFKIIPTFVMAPIYNSKGKYFSKNKWYTFFTC